MYNRISSALSAGKDAVSRAATFAVGTVTNAGTAVAEFTKTEAKDLAQLGSALTHIDKAKKSFEHAKKGLTAPFDAVRDILENNTAPSLTAVRQIVTGEEAKHPEPTLKKINIVQTTNGTVPLLNIPIKVIVETDVVVPDNSNKQKNETTTNILRMCAQTPILDIPIGIQKHIAWHTRSQHRKIACDNLSKHANAIRTKLITSISLLRNFQENLNAAQDNLQIGKAILTQLTQEQSSYTSLAVANVTTLLEKMSELLKNLIPGSQRASTTATVSAITDQVLNLIEKHQEDINNFNYALDQLLAILQNQESDFYQKQKQLNEFINQRLLKHFESMIAIYDAIDMFAESISQFRKYKFLMDWSSRVSICSSIATTTDYWNAITTLDADITRGYLEQLMRNCAYVNLGLAGFAAVNTILKARACGLSQKEIMVDLQYMKIIMNNILDSALRPLIKKCFSGGDWSAASYKKRNAVYQFMLKHLIEDSELFTALQNILLNLAIELPKKATEHTTALAGTKITGAVYSLLFSFKAFQEQLAYTRLTDDSLLRSPGLYRYGAEALGLRGYSLIAEDNPTYFLADLTVIAPMIYFLEMTLIQNLVGKRILPTMTGQYAYYCAHNTVTALNKNDALANLIKESLSQLLKDILFNGGEKPSEKQDAEHKDFFVRPLLAKVTHELVKTFVRVANEQGQKQLGITCITAPIPNELSRLQKMYGCFVDTCMEFFKLKNKKPSNSPETKQENLVKKTI